MAYRQFCQHFLAPLLLMARVDVRLSTLLRHYLDGIPLDLASHLLPRRTWLRFSSLLHIHLHAASIRRHAHREVGKRPQRVGSISRTGLLGLIASLQGAIRNLAWEPEDTEWARYTDDLSGSAYMETKSRWVRRVLEQMRPSVAVDLGANTGEFSRIAAEAGARVLSVDADFAAVERNYRALRTRNHTAILPLFVDLVNPVAGSGWAHDEREPFLERVSGDVVLALALVHHLAISNNLPLDRLAAVLARLAPDLIIEFVPKEDPRVQQLLASRLDIFPEYNRSGFERAFGHWFEIAASEPLEGSHRVLYHMVRR